MSFSRNNWAFCNSIFLSYKEFKFGVSDCTASIRIPWQVAKNEGGYIEDRRPNANCDPYKVATLIVEAVNEA